MFMVLSSWPIATARVHPIHLTNVGHCQVATDPPTKPTDLGIESTCIGVVTLEASTIAIYYYSAGKLRVEGWVGLGIQHAVLYNII